MSALHGFTGTIAGISLPGVSGEEVLEFITKSRPKPGKMKFKIWILFAIK